MLWQPFPYFVVLTSRTSGKNYLCLFFRDLLIPLVLIDLRLTAHTEQQQQPPTDFQVDCQFRLITIAWRGTRLRHGTHRSQVSLP